jgi:diaminohydroxyphosphoribosylaminopyrimidine deaminase/5-amino-6-(5-phosphoribosylamino)uracil reductase
LAPSSFDIQPDAERVRECLERLGRPFVRLKAAVTLDGKIATRTGESQWITGEPARKLGRSLRGAADGILVGIGTALADDPRLTVRDEARRDEARRDAGAADPARIVLDSTARLPPSARLLAADGARRIVVVGKDAPPARIAALQMAGAEVLALPAARPEPGAFLPALARLGLRTLLVEGGGRVHASLIAQGAADELWLFVAGRIMGDDAAPGWCGTLPGSARPDLAGMPRLRLAAPQSLDGGDILLRGTFEGPDSP